MDLIRTIGIAIDPSGAKAGAAAAAEALRSVGAAAASTEKATSRAISVLKSAGSGIASGAGRLASQFGVQGGIGGAADLIRGTLETAAALDRVRNILRHATQSDLASEREINFVRGAAERLGLEFESTSLAYAKFVAAGRLSKMTFQEIRDAFEGVAMAAAAMGASTAETEGVFSALAGLMSKSKVSVAELTQALADHLPGSLQYVANALNVSTPKLQKMIAEGDLLASNILPRIGVELKKQLGDEAVRNAKGTTGSITELKNAWTDFKLALVEAGLVDALKTLMGYIVGAVRALSTLPGYIATAAKELKAGLAEFGLNTDSGLAKGVIGIGALFSGTADWVKSIKPGELASKAIGPSQLPADDTYRVPGVTAARPIGQEVGIGLTNASQEMTRMFTKVTATERLLGQLEKAGGETAHAMADNFSSFFGGLVTEGGKAIDRLKSMFGNLARDIAMIFARRTIAEPIAGALARVLGIVVTSGGGGPTPKAGAGSAHTGGLIGTTGLTGRLVDPLLFLGAPRLHHGLAPDEFPAILQRGERVVPKSQAGAWDRGGGGVNINVNVDGSRGGTPAQNKAFGAEVARQIEAMVDARIARAAMPRGILRPAAAYA